MPPLVVVPMAADPASSSDPSLWACCVASKHRSSSNSSSSSSKRTNNLKTTAVPLCRTTNQPPSSLLRCGTTLTVPLKQSATTFVTSSTTLSHANTHKDSTNNNDPNNNPFHWRLPSEISFSDWTLQVLIQSCHDHPVNTSERPHVEQFHVHRWILACGPRRSEYFAQAFDDDDFSRVDGDAASTTPPLTNKKGMDENDQDDHSFPAMLLDMYHTVVCCGRYHPNRTNQTPDITLAPFTCSSSYGIAAQDPNPRTTRVTLPEQAAKYLPHCLDYIYANVMVAVPSSSRRQASSTPSKATRQRTNHSDHPGGSPSSNASVDTLTTTTTSSTSTSSNTSCAYSCSEDAAEAFCQELFTRESATALHYLADMFQIRRLEQDIQQFWQTDLQLDTAHIYYQHAKACDDFQPLLDAVANVCVQHYLQLHAEHTMLLFCSQDPQYWLTNIFQPTTVSTVTKPVSLKTSQLVCAMCKLHPDKMTPKLFAAMTDVSLMPFVDKECVEDLLTLHDYYLFHKNKPTQRSQSNNQKKQPQGDSDGPVPNDSTPTSLQLRCIDAIAEYYLTHASLAPFTHQGAPEGSSGFLQNNDHNNDRTTVFLRRQHPVLWTLLTKLLQFAEAKAREDENTIIDLCQQLEQTKMQKTQLELERENWTCRSIYNAFPTRSSPHVSPAATKLLRSRKLDKINNPHHYQQRRSPSLERKPLLTRGVPSPNQQDDPHHHDSDDLENLQRRRSPSLEREPLLFRPIPMVSNSNHGLHQSHSKDSQQQSRQEKARSLSARRRRLLERQQQQKKKSVLPQARVISVRVGPPSSKAPSPPRRVSSSSSSSKRNTSTSSSSASPIKMIEPRITTTMRSASSSSSKSASPFAVKKKNFDAAPASILEFAPMESPAPFDQEQQHPNVAQSFFPNEDDHKQTSTNMSSGNGKSSTSQAGHKKKKSVYDKLKAYNQYKRVAAVANSHFYQAYLKHQGLST